MEQEREIAINRGATRSRWLIIFLFLTGVLASTIVLKIAQIQYLEILYFIEIFVLLVVFSRNGYKVCWFRPYLRIVIWYLFFAGIALALAICALRYDFYFPGPITPLKYPVVITISRIVELFASVSIMIYLAGKFREDPTLAAFTMRVYFWVGVISAAFSIATFPLSFAGIELGTYGDSHRMRGFYNEGGPYGLYLISVFLIGIALYRKKWLKKRSYQFALVILCVGFLGSQSKAAFLAAVIILLVNGLLVRSFARRAVLVTGIAIFLIGIYQVVDFGTALRIYQRGSQAYEVLSHQHRNDGNFVVGRIAGTFLVPRMVETHPWVGVGWGNYGLVRNAPEYRGAAAFAFSNDDPALGLAGMTAELGVPLLLYLTVCLLLPFIYLRKKKVPLYITNLALLQPIVHLFGGQLNLTYPWIVTAFALGLGYSLSDTVNSHRYPMKVPQNYLLVANEGK